jgi:hypothetical protein
MSKKIKSKIATYLFHKEFASQQRQHATVTFNDAKSIGIIYDSTNEQNYDIIRRYVKELRDIYKKDVLALGYYDKKALPNDRYAKLGLDFFTRKALNWHYKPVAPIVRNFMERDFDILIDLHTSNSIAFRYITAATKARFKIGKYSRYSAPFYDFMISVSDAVTLPGFIEQVNHYLKLIRHED